MKNADHAAHLLACQRQSLHHEVSGTELNARWSRRGVTGNSCSQERQTLAEERARGFWRQPGMREGMLTMFVEGTPLLAHSCWSLATGSLQCTSVPVLLHCWKTYVSEHKSKVSALLPPRSDYKTPTKECSLNEKPEELAFRWGERFVLLLAVRFTRGF